MTKEELVYITLKELSESFKVSPECFQTDQDTTGNYSVQSPAILWRFRVELNGKNIPDPNNANRSVLVTYSELSRQICCHIYFRDVESLSRSIMPDAEAIITVPRIEFFSKSYRKFYFLRRRIIKRKQGISGMEYLSKLRTIFPTTHDDDIFR